MTRPDWQKRKDAWLAEGEKIDRPGKKSTPKK